VEAIATIPNFRIADNPEVIRYRSSVAESETCQPTPAHWIIKGLPVDLDSPWDYEMRKGFSRKPQADEPGTRFKNYFTPSGLERLKDEHRFLLTRERPDENHLHWK
jgi:hypothetical protein